VSCNVLQCVAVCCSVLQRVEVWFEVDLMCWPSFLIQNDLCIVSPAHRDVYPSYTATLESHFITWDQPLISLIIWFEWFAHCLFLLSLSKLEVKANLESAKNAQMLTEIRYILLNANIFFYGVATISRLLKIIGLFCKRAL